jgi:ferredoxin
MPKSKFKGGGKMPHKITDDCIMCGTCKEECPAEAISEGDPKYEINPELCTDCAACADVCPVEACVPE